MSPQADIEEISVANNSRICCSCARVLDVYLLLTSRLRADKRSGLARTTNKGIDRYEECDYQGCCRCSFHHVGRLPGFEPSESRYRQSQAAGEPSHRGSRCRQEL